MSELKEVIFFELVAPRRKNLAKRLKKCFLTKAQLKKVRKKLFYEKVEKIKTNSQVIDGKLKNVKL